MFRLTQFGIYASPLRPEIHVYPCGSPVEFMKDLLLPVPGMDGTIYQLTVLAVAVVAIPSSGRVGAVSGAAPSPRITGPIEIVGSPAKKAERKPLCARLDSARRR